MLRFLLSVCVCGLIPVTVRGEIPLQVNHQGLVKVNGVAFDGNGDFRFALVDPDTGNNLWTNDGTNVPGPGTPTNAVNLPVINGIYNVRLGDTTLPNMTSVSSTVFNDDNVLLRIWFDDTQGNGVGQLAPDHVLTSTPYAFRVHDGVTLSGNQTITGEKTFTGTATFSDVAQLLAGSQTGDMFVHSASGLSRLGPGDSGRFLQSQGTGIVPLWAFPGGVSGIEVQSASTNVGWTAVCLGGQFFTVPGVAVAITVQDPGNPILVIFNGSLINAENRHQGGVFQLLLDGGPISATTRHYSLLSAAGHGHAITIVHATFLPAGVHTFNVQVKPLAGCDIILKDRTVVVIEFRTAG